MTVQEGYGLLYSTAAIIRQVQLHAEIIDQYCQREQIAHLWLLVCIEGANPYATDLTRALSRLNPGLAQTPRSVKVSRYGNEMIGSSEFEIRLPPPADIRGKDVLIVEDIVEEGRTLKKLYELTEVERPRSVVATAITEKVGAQIVPLPDRLTPPLPIIRGDDGRYPWVEGYGMDTDGRFRELEYIRYRR